MTTCRKKRRVKDESGIDEAVSKGTASFFLLRRMLKNIRLRQIDWASPNLSKSTEISERRYNAIPPVTDFSVS